MPELARSVIEIIERERQTNRRFTRAFTDFAELARRSINPNLADAAIEQMLIQHLLTERLFRTSFNSPMQAASKSSQRPNHKFLALS